MVKNLPANAGAKETWVQFLGREDPLEEEMATHSHVLARETPYSCWENPMDRRGWEPAVHGVAKSWTQLSDCVHIHK